MELRIQKSELTRGLRLAQSIADRKSTMPMLANVLLRAQGQKETSRLLIAATDLNVSLSAELTCHNTTEGGLTVNAKALHDIVVALPGDELTIKRADNSWAEIRAGKVTYRIVGMPDRDFPKVPDHREAPFGEVQPAVLREMIDRTLFSVCNDETRFHLNGVLFECNGSQARMVSTDGHRLSKVERSLPGGPTLTAGVIIPKKGLLEIKRVLDGAATCKLAVKTPYAFVQADDIVLAVKLIDAQFPPYEQVVPKEHRRSLVVDRHLLIDALKRAQLMSSETRGVKLSMAEGTLTVASDNPDVGEVREELEADFTGEPVAIGFNPKYVIDLLAQMASDQVALELGGELDPGLFKPLGADEYLGVVMPMRI
jgi:DNA polymerase III subunit beta